MVEIDTLFQTKTAINKTFWRRIYLYSRYKGLPPPPCRGEKRFADYASETNK